jgi:hypothetical protein
MWLYNKCGLRRRPRRSIILESGETSCSLFFTMSPHRISVLPSSSALPEYSISKNGFLPAEPPLSRLPQAYYCPWEQIIERLPLLIETQKIRQCVDELPVLETSHLDSEAEWQRAHSMLAVMAQGYIWTGPEPSEVSRAPYSAEWRLVLNKDIATASCNYHPFPSDS